MDRYPLIWEIRYAMRFGQRQSKALDKVAMTLRVLGFTAGTAAFFSVVDGDPLLTKWAGLSVAFVAVLDAVWNPAGRAAKARELGLRFSILNRDAPSLTDEQLQREFDGLYDADAPEWKSLRPVVYNDTVKELGNSPDARCTLTPWQWLVGKVV